MRVFLAVLVKEIRIEMRTKEILTASSLFAVLVVVMSSLSLYLDGPVAKAIAPGVLWIATTFTGILATGRSWNREREEGVFKALILSGASPAAIYLGKAAALYCFVLAISFLLLPITSVFFRIGWGDEIGYLLALILLGDLGFVAVATLFGAMTVRTRSRDLLLSIAIFPLLAPALLSAVVGTRELFTGAATHEVLGWLQLLLAFDLLFLFGGSVLFKGLAMDAD